MSEGKFKGSVVREGGAAERGVDLSQIRRMLALSPAERLRVGVANSRTAFRLFGAARGK
jgi:hypothetical protein